MIRSFLGFLIFLLVWQMGTPQHARAERPYPPLKVAFLRDGHLWMKMDEQKEVQVTHEGQATEPKWSWDGKWVAFYQNHDIWVYNTATKLTHRVTHASGTQTSLGLRSLQWLPAAEGYKLSFLDGDTLDIVDLNTGRPSSIVNVANGVSDFTWMPNKDRTVSLLAASRACMQPNGWTQPVIYKIPLSGAYRREQIKPFFTIPQTINVGNVKVPAFGAYHFKWSGNYEWLTFLVSGSASMSMDENALCVLSADGKTFHAVDVVLQYPQWYQWAPFPARLGYLAGGGREVLDPVKALTISDIVSEDAKHFGQGKGLLPMRMRPSVERPFTFGNVGMDMYVSLDQAYVPTKTPWLDQTHPAIYRLILEYDKMIAITHPPAGWGDINPHFLRRHHKLLFVRTDGKQRNVWISKTDGQGARAWIANIEGDIVIYGERN